MLALAWRDLGSPEEPLAINDGCSLDSHLSNWARWMRIKDGPEGYPDSASGGFLGYSTVDWDSEGAYAKLDAELAEHCNAAIDSLPPAHQCAIYHSYGLTAVYRFPRGNYDAVLEAALTTIRLVLIRRGVVVT